MATAVMLDVNHDVPQADAHEEEPSPEATQETTAQGMDKALPGASLHVYSELTPCSHNTNY
jgi:hypothetical protein